jgi:hypothetical protein
VEISADHDSIAFHLAEILNEHLLADSRDKASQLAETARIRPKVPENQHLPLPSDNIERGFQPAAIHRAFHVFFF